MTKSEMYLNRLIKFGRKLGEQEFLMNANTHEYNIEYESDLSVSNIECFSWALKALPKTFKAWTYKENDIPILKGQEKLSTLMATALYFDLTVDELFYLFVPGYNEYTYKYTTGSELANLIFDFVEEKSKLINEHKKQLN